MKHKLTQFSHGAGCGCKIAPDQLERILSHSGSSSVFADLLVGHATKDDAAVYRLGSEGIVSTTDFFTPIVDDAFDFGEIASVNALSDIYAMGGEPLMAIAILGWPIDKLPIETAGEVVRGARAACERAGIPLAGGHSIDLSEPIFGLAATGRVALDRIKSNSGAREGDVLYLSKPLGIGLITTAQKKGLSKEPHLRMALESMKKLNQIGSQLSQIKAVNALTDVTGFGLAGHLLELCESSGLSAEIDFAELPIFEWARSYADQGCAPGGTSRNLRSYGHRLHFEGDFERMLLADPQTSGGLLISVSVEGAAEVEQMLAAANCSFRPIGRMRVAENKNPGLWPGS